jgi:hypothetical protein
LHVAGVEEPDRDSTRATRLTLLGPSSCDGQRLSRRERRLIGPPNAEAGAWVPASTSSRRSTTAAGAVRVQFIGPGGGRAQRKCETAAVRSAEVEARVGVSPCREYPPPNEVVPTPRTANGEVDVSSGQPIRVHGVVEAVVRVREAPRCRPRGRACRCNAVSGNEPVGEVELVGDGSIFCGCDVDVAAPRLARVVVDSDVDGLARRPVGTGERDGLARRVVGLVGPDRGRRRCLHRRASATRERQGRKHQPRKEH